MTHRERVLTALDHKEPDRVPIDFGAMRSTGIMALAYNKLKRHLGISSSTRVYDLMQQLAEPDLQVLEYFDADVVQVHRLCPSFGLRIDRWKEYRLADGFPVVVPEGFDPIKLPDGSEEIREGGRTIGRRPAAAPYFDRVNFPLAEAKSIEDIDRFQFGSMTDEELTFIRRQAEHWRATDYAILAAFGGNILEGGQFTFGWDRFMTLLALERDMVERFLDRLVESYLRDLDRFLPTVEGLVDIIQVGDDLGTQQGLQISPQMYREVIKPRQARIYGHIKKHSTARLFLHSCGSIVEILDDLIEIGVDILNPVQTSARGMDPVELKRRFGSRLVFWGGGCDTQRVLPRGSIEDVKRDVRDRIRIFAPGGGFVFTQIHNIQADIPPEKIVALYKTALEAGRYPIR